MTNLEFENQLLRARLTEVEAAVARFVLAHVFADSDGGPVVPVELKELAEIASGGR